MRRWQRHAWQAWRRALLAADALGRRRRRWLQRAWQRWVRGAASAAVFGSQLAGAALFSRSRRLRTLLGRWARAARRRRHELAAAATRRAICAAQGLSRWRQAGARRRAAIGLCRSLAGRGARARRHRGLARAVRAWREGWRKEVLRKALLPAATLGEIRAEIRSLATQWGQARRA